jgi:hypothetical protein
VSDLTNYTERSDRDLALSAGVQAGNQIEAMRRLRVAVERQSRASTVLTWAIIVLMVVQIAVALMSRAH